MLLNAHLLRETASIGLRLSNVQAVNIFLYKNKTQLLQSYLVNKTM